MADIISKQELPVTITKVKIGTKDLNKSIIDQLPLDWYIYHKRPDGFRAYGLPVLNTNINKYPDLIFDKDTPYKVAGELIGYVNASKLASRVDLDFIKSINNNYFTENGFTYSLRNYSDSWRFILFCSEGKLKKTYLDTWTIDQLDIDIENMQIFI